MNSMVYYNYKRKGYATDFCNSNFENNLDAAMISISIKRDYINSGCIYSNINNKQQNPILQFLFAINNIKDIAFILNPPISIIVFYCNKSQLFLLND